MIQHPSPKPNTDKPKKPTADLAPAGRRRIRRHLAVTLALFLAFSGLGAAFAAGFPQGEASGLDAGAATGYSAYMSGLEKQKTAYAMLALVNAARSGASAPALKWDTELEKAAIARAREAAIYFSHTRPTGAQWYTANSRLSAENLYVGYMASPSTANDGWMDSSGHRTNRLNTAYKSYAAACFQGRDGAAYWVEVFSRTTSVSTTAANRDRSLTIATVRVSDGYLSLAGTPTDLDRNTIGSTDLRAGYEYYYTLRNWNLQFDVSSSLMTRGAFTSSNSNVATVDPRTGRIKALKAGQVTITAKLSSYSGKKLTRTLVVRPAKVKTLTAVARSKGVTLTFAPAPGATGHQIYRASAATGEYTLVGTASATATTWSCSSLTSGKTYYFKVRGYYTKPDSTTKYTGYFATPVAVKAL